jgi:hypothetical protein
MIPVYDGKCLSRKAVHNWAKIFSQGCSKVADEVRPGAEMIETTIKNFCAASFEALVKRWDKCINVDGGSVEKQMFLGSNITCFTFYIHL